MTTEPIEATAVVVSEQMSPSLFGTSDPVEIVAKARDVANALKDVIRTQGLISNIQGKEYVRVEGWTLLGSMLGIFPVNVWTREVEGGWEARVEARTGTGNVVGAAEAQCTRNESTWAKRDAYALRSMAQTRATSKALRMPLGFVVTLAGFEATPAEEMTFANSDGIPKRAVTPATEKQQNYVRRLLRELVDKVGAEDFETFIAGLHASYPAAIAGGRLIVNRLTMGDAGELIELLKGQLTDVDPNDLPQE